jgi:hypothetical protein
MPPLPPDLRKTLENAVVLARRASAEAARAALTWLAVARSEPFASMTPDQRQLRVALRAVARQLGDDLNAPEAQLPLLTHEIAYEQWHRMLFARFLAENGLLMHPGLHVAVTLEECAELAGDEGASDAWELAARYAGEMLPGIFRRDDPTIRVRLAPEGRQKLEALLAGLPSAVFTSDDGLGWVYQFWQTEKKKEVNASGRKIGGADLAPVTQLFTEDYMVRFLLENSLGAWWAARHPESPLVKGWSYLRFVDGEGGARTPAAGAFPGWPERAAEVTVMDPCGGSGHFVVAAFEMLRRMRMEEEGLGESAAADAVIRDNVFMLELDPRCTQIGAFALILAAWKAGGYRPLPLPNIACSGIAVTASLDEWLRLGGKDERLRTALERLWKLFRDAPTLGSLIDPADVPLDERLFSADYEEVAPLLERALAAEKDDPAAAVLGAAAEGIAKAARLLARRYVLVATNVPYLTTRRQVDELRAFSDRCCVNAKADLATMFLDRSRGLAASGGTCAAVAPQNWLFLSSYRRMREQLLLTQEWILLARLGARAFETISGEVVNVILIVLTNAPPKSGHVTSGVTATAGEDSAAKARLLRYAALQEILQRNQLKNPDARITLDGSTDAPLLGRYASCYAGILNGDSPRFQRFYWEIETQGDLWVCQQSTVERSVLYGGRERLILFDEAEGHLRELSEVRREKLHDSDQRGNRAWGKKGIAISQIGGFPTTLYTGEKFDSNVAVLIPSDQSLVPALSAFCSSPEFRIAVRRIDSKLNVTNATFAKVPIDVDVWKTVAATVPLAEPYSNDPSQWLFNGHPAGSSDPLQVAVARLIGYRWPQQPDDDLGAFADADGVVCLSALTGEAPAAERLRDLLAHAYAHPPELPDFERYRVGDHVPTTPVPPPDGWSAETLDRLLAHAGYAGKTLDEWLRDAFFAQHCRLFHNRPFAWHVWDGRKDGFSALANYHRLDRSRLEKLAYTYLGAWITRQRADRDAGVSGADGRLVAALELQKKLEAILHGEPLLDVYVRWKPLHQQPIGWEPDLNDGVRLNIRPFVEAGVLRSRFTINWNKDRGKNPDGSERFNDVHLTRSEKEAARERASESERCAV